MPNKFKKKPTVFGTKAHSTEKPLNIFWKSLDFPYVKLLRIQDFVQLQRYLIVYPKRPMHIMLNSFSDKSFDSVLFGHFEQLVLKSIIVISI